MVVWQLRKPVQFGEKLLLPPATSMGGSNALMAKPWYSYILCFKRLSSDSSGDHQRSTFDSSDCEEPPDLYNSSNIAGGSLQQVYMALEEGTFQPSMLEAADADALLERVIVEGDDEVRRCSKLQQWLYAGVRLC